MVTLNHFNQLTPADAGSLLEPCVAVPAWTHTLVTDRPYPSLKALIDHAQDGMRHWGEAELTQALSAHPRIGEKPTGSRAHAGLSRQEQSAVNADDRQLAAALATGNARYEARFGRVFLIRAKGRSGGQILQALNQRLDHSDAQELEVSLAQLREITLLRLTGAISD